MTVLLTEYLTEGTLAGATFVIETKWLRRVLITIQIIDAFYTSFSNTSFAVRIKEIAMKIF